MKYYKCNKCGILGCTNTEPPMCTCPFPLRTSGICGGEFKEIPFDDFKKQLKDKNLGLSD